MDRRYIELQNCMNIGITSDDKFEKFYLNDFENGGGI